MNVSKRLGACLVLLVAMSLTFTVTSALTEHAFIKTHVANLIFKESNIESLTTVMDDSNFNPVTIRYDNATVTVKNYSDAPASATVYVVIFDVNGESIAQGKTTVSNLHAGNTAIIMVGLEWEDGKTDIDAFNGHTLCKEYA